MTDINLDNFISNFDDDDDLSSVSNINEYVPDGEEDGEQFTECYCNKGDLILLSQEEKDFIKQHQGESLEDVFNKNISSTPAKTVLKEDINVYRELTEEEKARQAQINENKKIVFIDTKEFVCACIREGVNAQKKISSDKETVRTYDKKAEMPKISYGNPYVEKGIASKIKPFIFACLGAGIFFGYMGNAYYNHVGGNTNNAISCAFGWIMETDMSYEITSFVPEIFLPCFGIGVGILAVFGIFIYLDKDTKKNSRVGHEHGNAHLGKARDFKIYKKKFME